MALNAATLPHVIALADKGAQKAMADNPHLARGLNVQGGKVTYPAVAQALNLPLAEAAE
jgi:alanine dehydrogenase